MAHQQQRDFCLSVRNKLPAFFKGKWVLDMGSLDINGNNQYLFEDCGYLGVDLLPGRNVDFTGKGHEILFPDASFDVIISTECFEHDPYHARTIPNLVRMLKPGGLFLFSCATTGRPEHGTRRTTPGDAPFTQHFGDWGDYYRNLEEGDIRQILDIEQCFAEHEFSVQHDNHDLYFWGVKRGALLQRNDYSFLLGGSGGQHRSRAGSHEALQSRLEDVEHDRQQALARLAESEARLVQVQSRLEAAHAGQQELAERLERLQRSRSWRLTRPLRLAGRLARGELATGWRRLGRALLGHFRPPR